MHSRTKALVLRSVDYKDTDKILTLLTPELGKLTASARGSRRRGSPLAAGTRILTYADMVLYEYRGRWAVKEAAVEREFRALERDVLRLSLGCYFAEAAELLSVEDLPARELLSLTLNSLHVLDRQPQRPLEQVRAGFELRLLCLSGFEPDLSGCAVCGKVHPAQARFFPREGVLRCRSCTEKGEGESIPVTEAVLSALRYLTYSEPKRLFSFRLEGEALDQLSRLCERYLLAQLDRGFATLDFYKSLFR